MKLLVCSMCFSNFKVPCLVALILSAASALACDSSTFLWKTLHSVLCSPKMNDLYMCGISHSLTFCIASSVRSPAQAPHFAPPSPCHPCIKSAGVICPFAPLPPPPPFSVASALAVKVWIEHALATCLTTQQTLSDTLPHKAGGRFSECCVGSCSSSDALHHMHIYCVSVCWKTHGEENKLSQNTQYPLPVYFSSTTLS